MNSTVNRRVLVLDADMVPALTIARSLRQRDCRVDVASHVEWPITRHSRCVEDCFQYPDPLADTPGFLRFLAEHCRRVSYDLVIPVTERSLVPISNERECFEHVRVAMPSRDSLELVLDKDQTMALAQSLGVHTPVGITVSSEADLEARLSTINYPVVLKPARSLSTNARGSSQLRVSYAFDEGELRAGCRHGLRFGPILLQEYFRGEGMGVELIAREGEVAYAFQHLRLHEVPITGGGSSLRKSVPLEPSLLEASEKLVAALNWNGVAMVEFKWRADTGAFSLMEINGRFWGSLPLADSAGADFPSMLLDLELEGEVVPCEPYRPDVYCRKLSSDLHWYEAVLRRDEAESRIVELPDGWAIVRNLRTLFLRRHYFDVQSFSDPVPGLVDIWHIVASYGRRFSSLAAERWFFWQQRRAWRRGDVARAINGSRSLLFLCYGNINRSALADALARDYAEDSGVAVVSAGLHQEEGRPADPVMVEVARENGVDLGGSRSTAVSTEMLRESDVIFVMEKQHVESLVAMDPALKPKLFLLGAYPGAYTGSPEIADPYGRSKQRYQLCFRRIAESIDHIKSVLACRYGEY